MFLRMSVKKKKRVWLAQGETMVEYHRRRKESLTEFFELAQGADVNF